MCMRYMFQIVKKEFWRLGKTFALLIRRVFQSLFGESLFIRM